MTFVLALLAAKILGLDGLRPSLLRIRWVASKELLHMARDRAVLFFTVVNPVLQLLIIGYGVDTNIRHTRTVVLDQARTQESRALLRRFQNSDSFDLVEEVFTDEQLSQALVAGRGRVGIKIPEHYSRRLKQGKTAQVLVLVDGASSSVASEAVNGGNAVALRESLERVLNGQPLPVEARPLVLFNPDTRSAVFLLPSLLIILTQTMAVLLTASAVVREKEKGTLDQLLLTPVRRWELMTGKLLPYLGLTMLEFCGIALLMWSAFDVPIRGSFLTLLLLQLPFLLTALGLGLLISTRAATRDAAMQMTFATVLPSLFLSGYLFPLESMTPFFAWVGRFLPTTWMIEAARAVVIRGAGLADLLPHFLVLWAMALVVLCAACRRFGKQAG
jgi:ABC-2 type transport system permease protein